MTLVNAPVYTPIRKDDVTWDTIHVIKIDGLQRDPTQTVFINITNLVESAQRDDVKNGYGPKGPNVGQEIMKAIEYASYIQEHATVDDLYNFNKPGYHVFSNTGDKETNSVTA